MQTDTTTMNEGDAMETGTSTLMLAIKGAIGVVTPIMGFTVSAVQELELWLRIVSLCVGIAVGTVTFISLIKNLNRNKR